MTPLEGTPKKLFVDRRQGARLRRDRRGTGNASYRNRECTYGYDCDFTGDGTATKLLVFDIADRAAPQLEREVALSGSLIAGRRVGSAVHTVVTQAANPFSEASSISRKPTVRLRPSGRARPRRTTVRSRGKRTSSCGPTTAKLIEHTDLDATHADV